RSRNGNAYSCPQPASVRKTNESVPPVAAAVPAAPWIFLRAARPPLQLRRFSRSSLSHATARDTSRDKRRSDTGIHPPNHRQKGSRSEEHTSELQSLAYLVC